MARFSTLSIAVVALLLGVSTASAQTVTVTPKTDNFPVNPPPAGQKDVYAEGTYTLMPGQTIERIRGKWYQEAGQNLIFVGQNDDSSPANNKYKTGTVTVPLTNDQGMPILYTVVAELYITGNPNPVTAAVFQNYKP